MASIEPVTPDTGHVLDVFPLPPAHNANSLKTPNITVPASPPEAVEKYQTKALPPLPLKFTQPTWAERSSSLTPAPLAAKSTRPATPQPTPSSPKSLAVQRPRTASEDRRMSVIEREIIRMAWVEPTKSLGESTSSDAPSLADTTRDTSIDSRPENSQHTLPTVDEPFSPTSKKQVPTLIQPIVRSVTPPTLPLQPSQSAQKILSLTGSTSALPSSPGLLSPSGHNSAFKIRKMFGIETEVGDSVPISPVSSVMSCYWAGAASAPVSEPDSEDIYTRNLLDTRPDHEAWMGPSPTLPPLEIDGSLGFSTENFKLPDVIPERRAPRTLRFTEPHPVRDLYHFSVLNISEEKRQEDGTKTTVIEVGKAKKKGTVKSPAQYSFFPRKESFSSRRRNSAAQGNGKLPPTPLVPKPKFVQGKHPVKTPFPDGNIPLTAGPDTSGPRSADLSTPGLPTGSVPRPSPVIEEDDFADVSRLDEIYRSAPTSAFDLDEDHKARSFISEKRASALSHVFKRHLGTSKEDKRKSKDSFASIGSHGFFKPSPRHITSMLPTAIITTTIGTPERASSFTSNESAGWFSSHFGAGGSTANTTPTSTSAVRFSNPFSRSSTPLPGERSEAELDEETTPSKKKKKTLKMKINPPSLHLLRSASTKKGESPATPVLTSPGRVGIGKSTSRREKSAERRRNSMKNKIRIIPEGEVVEPGVPNSMKPAASKRSSKRLSGHSWLS